MIDSRVLNCIKKELKRQQDHIELIASENFVSPDVLAAQGSILTNKYAEGYPGKRYYGGCYAVDEAEQLAIDRVCQLFQCNYANVQPHSGSQANLTVFLALLKPGDTVLGMNLASGGHLSHGSPPNISGKWFQAYGYDVDPITHLLDMDHIKTLAKQYKPKLIIAGASTYSRIIDFKAFRDIADEVGAFLLADIAHIAGLVAGGLHPSPFPHAHVVTSTTHKTLRGPRGGIILWNEEDLTKPIQSALFPGLQGGPLMHIIAAKAVCFYEALQPSFKAYGKNILVNARVLAETLMEEEFPIISGGTDNHLMLVDLRPCDFSGKKASDLLEAVNITCNKNAIPGDTRSPFLTSGIRLGSPAMTTRGCEEDDMKIIGKCIASILRGKSSQEEVLDQVRQICDHYPLPYTD